MKRHQQKFERTYTIREFAKQSSQKYANETAFELADGELITYKQFYQDIEALGSAMIGSLGLRSNKIAVSGKNSYQWCTAYFAVACGAGVVTPIDRELPFEEILNLIEFAEIKAIVADKAVTKKLMKNFDELPKDFIIISSEDIENERVLNFEDTVRLGRSLIRKGFNEYSKIEIDKNEMAVILFTSGTTGMAKGVMLSNDNLCSDIYNVFHSVSLSKNDKLLSFLPIHHAYECMTMLMSVYAGATVAFSGGLRYIADDFTKYKPTIFVCVPLLLEKLHAKIMKNLNESEKAKLANFAMKTSDYMPQSLRKSLFKDVHEIFGGSLRYFIVGAAALKPEVARDFKSFGIPAIIGFGLTECSPIVICNGEDNITFDSIGKPLPDVEAKIIKPDENGIGEICVKGPMIMLGYYKNIQESERVLKNGWFHTGDLGFLDKKKNFHITGRSKNVIVTKNGKNIYPEEIEYYLNSDPMIQESIIFSDTDDESVSAKVVVDEDMMKQELKKETLTNDDKHNAVQGVIRKINSKLPSYKSIKKFEIKDEAFEKTTTHKIKRHKELGEKK